MPTTSFTKTPKRTSRKKEGYFIPMCYAGFPKKKSDTVVQSWSKRNIQIVPMKYVAKFTMNY